MEFWNISATLKADRPTPYSSFMLIDWLQTNALSSCYYTISSI
jgi:hypothetical protein